MVKSTIKEDAKTKKKPEKNLTILTFIRIEKRGFDDWCSKIAKMGDILKKKKN